MRNPSQNYGVSLALWDHTMLLATRHERTHPALTPASKVGTQFTYPGRMEGWVDLGELITPRPGVEPATAWSKVRCPNFYFRFTIETCGLENSTVEIMLDLTLLCSSVKAWKSLSGKTAALSQENRAMPQVFSSKVCRYHSLGLGLLWLALPENIPKN